MDLFCGIGLVVVVFAVALVFFCSFVFPQLGIFCCIIIIFVVVVDVVAFLLYIFM